MSEEYTQPEKVLMARFMLERTMHEWEQKEKITYIAMLNRRAGLPFGTIGLLRTEHKDKKSGTVKITEVPYASRQTTVELGKLNKITVEIKERDINDKFFLFVARATNVDEGRSVEATGVCAATGFYGPLEGDFMANKIMHAETKAKRRATLEVCGLAFLDESETESMEGAKAIELTAPDSTTPAEAPPKSKPEAPKPTPSKPSAPVAVVASETPTASSASAASQPMTPAPSPSIAKICDPIPARYEDVDLFNGDDDSILVGDKAHIDFIVAEGKGKCGWDGQVLAKWLLDSFGVRSKNANETLTLGVFKRIMGGIDDALTSAGR